MQCTMARLGRNHHSECVRRNKGLSYEAECPNRGILVCTLTYSLDQPTPSLSSSLLLPVLSMVDHLLSVQCRCNHVQQSLAHTDRLASVLS